jgi:hypothetical protein
MALTLLPTKDVDEVAATQAAWAIVAEAYARAAKVPDVHADDHAMFVRCIAKASRLAGRSPFDVLDGGNA